METTNTPHSWPVEELRRIGSRLQIVATDQKLGDWLTGSFPFFTRDEWLSQIKSGLITVDQKVIVDPDYRLSRDQQIARLHPISEEPDVNTSLKVLWQDCAIAVVEKPAGLVMHESSLFRRKTVDWVLSTVLGSGWHPVHRLDRETSGVLLCAKGTSLRRMLAKALEKGEIHKAYLAHCCGVPLQESWTEARPIIPANSPRGRASIGNLGDEHAHHATTLFRLLKQYSDSCLIEAKPKTGRTHQIRVHLQASGLPVIGDKLYGADQQIFSSYLSQGNSEFVKSIAGCDFHRLHASELCFTHPLSGEEIHVTSQPTWKFDQDTAAH